MVQVWAFLFFHQPIKSQNGPAPIARSDSGSTFSTTSMPLGSSRGPSPLTIGMSDTIPLAVAFTDTIHAFFKGTDATRSGLWCWLAVCGHSPRVC